MNILCLIIGVLLGWGLKYAFDFYHDFKTIEEKRASELDDVLTRFKAIELNKNN